MRKIITKFCIGEIVTRGGRELEVISINIPTQSTDVIHYLLSDNVWYPEYLILKKREG